MKAYYSYFSAAALWNIPYFECVAGSKIAETEPGDFTVTKRSKRSYKKGRTIHLCERTLPNGSVVTKNGKRVASPELLFLQLACRLSMHRLILLGLQLCSHPPGSSSEAITTKKSLNTFLSKTQGHHGHKKALRAVKYIEDGSASVIESIVYMIMTLPNALGGYGLSGAVFNHEIELKAEAGKRLGQRRCFMDLYYKSAKLAVEYESFAFHNSPSDQGKDAIRAAMIDRQGIEVMHLNTIQLYDNNASMDFAVGVASRLGKRIQIRTKRFDEMHALLRTLLPSGKSAARPEAGPSHNPPRARTITPVSE